MTEPEDAAEDDAVEINDQDDAAEVDEEDDDVASEPGDLPVVTNQVKVRDPYT